VRAVTNRWEVEVMKRDFLALTIAVIIITVLISLSVVIGGCSREKLKEIFTAKEKEEETSSIEEREIEKFEKRKQEMRAQLEEEKEESIADKEVKKFEERKQGVKRQLSKQEEGTLLKSISSVAGVFLIADFNSGEKPNKLGGNFGAWDKDPQDFTQFAIESFISTIKHGNEGYSVQIVYDVASSNSAYNGFWMKLNNLDASEFNNFNFWVKGDEKRGFTKVFKVELKNSRGEVGGTYISGITDKWQKISIPFSEFKEISDFGSLEEFVIVFEDRVGTVKEGAIYLDDIYLNK